MADEAPRSNGYSIGEVSEKVNQEPHVLRYWEQEFDALHPQKDRAGRRVYTDADVDTVRLICHLLKEERYTIEGARLALERIQKQKAQHEAIRDDLQQMRAFLTSVLERL